MSTSEQAFPAVRPTAAECISCWVNQTRLKSIPPADKPNASQDANANVSAEYPREVWRYRSIEGIGEDVVFEFVDACRCGDYHRTAGSSEQALAAGVKPEARQPVGLFRSPPLKFPDLAVAIEKVHSSPLPFDVLADYVRVTGATTLVPITLQFRIKI